MNIERITLCNITSIEGEHTIDFTSEPLRSAGLFAITGDTGAGKSSILDAICLALYNQAPRLEEVQKLESEQLETAGIEKGVAKPHDTRTFLRRGATTGHAYVRFLANDGQRYEAQWRARINKKGNHDEIKHYLLHIPFERDYLHSVVSVEIDERGKADYRLLDYAPLVRLRRIPEQGMATPEKLWSLLSALPAAEGDRETWPYLEVHVQVEQPEPQLRHQLAETVRDKAVRFCRIVPSTRSKRTESSDALPTLEGALQQLQPIDIAQRFYEERFGQPMPESLVGRFHQAQNSLSSAE